MQKRVERGRGGTNVREESVRVRKQQIGRQIWCRRSGYVYRRVSRAISDARQLLLAEISERRDSSGPSTRD